ncbi:putative F-box/FBD/LRR-repeat protein [Carex littledalei]|uniref:Putative F-box/FBD/LRR-repeat protein n=1 Tax=Carex littledalei TaxID=544730 RepID=A0A833VPN9_9POAL|nr:putative F-box/FBD/LRR-repeat protein [Carex littledalei]
MDIHIFRIICEGLNLDFLDVSFPEAAEWIAYAADHNPKMIELSFDGLGYCTNYIPDCLFNCKTLEEVKLKMPMIDMGEIKPNKVYLPRLRKLNLNGVNFGSDNLEKILSGCPILEDLRMEYCALKMSSFACHSVKRLQLLSPKISQETISISVPCVENIVFRNDIDMDYGIILKDARKVTQAILLSTSSVNQQKYPCHLLSRLWGVEHLEISSSFIEDTLQGGMQKFPMFHNLKSLFIQEFSVCCDFDAWSSFIKHCTNLEKLYFKPLEELCKGDEKHNRVQMHKNLEKTEGFPCKNLKKVGIVYRELCTSMCKLSRLIKQQTKEIKGIEIVFIRNSVSFEHGSLFDRLKMFEDLQLTGREVLFRLCEQLQA